MLIFSAKRLTLARACRGLTRKALAEMLDLSAQIITYYEDRLRIPSDSILMKASFELSFPKSFFYADDIELIKPESVTFRSSHALRMREQNKALAIGALVTDVLSPNLRNRFQFPKTDVPDFSGETPEQAAQMLRDYWQLGRGPIHHVVHLMESKGVEVFWINEPVSSLDAVSLWRNDLPYILLNSYKEAGDRARFDAAHELGHLILHRHEKTLTGQKIEMEANSFASAFLLPIDQFRLESPKYPLLNEYLPLKRRWGVSIQAMIRRGRDIGIFNDWYYEKALKQISIQGWRQLEPIPIKREHSLLHKLAFDNLEVKNITVEDFARSVHLQMSDLITMMPVIEEFIKKAEISAVSQTNTITRNGTTLHFDTF